MEAPCIWRAFVSTRMCWITSLLIDSKIQKWSSWLLQKLIMVVTTALTFVLCKGQLTVSWFYSLSSSKGCQTKSQRSSLISGTSKETHLFMRRTCMRNTKWCIFCVLLIWLMTRSPTRKVLLEQSLNNFMKSRSWKKKLLSLSKKMWRSSRNKMKIWGFRKNKKQVTKQKDKL